MIADPIQNRALQTWYSQGHELHRNLIPSTLGLVGEAGEFADLVKKIHFKPQYARDEDDLLDELGDVLYYLAILAYQLGITLDELSWLNYNKLILREADGTGYNKGE